MFFNYLFPFLLLLYCFPRSERQASSVGFILWLHFGNSVFLPVKIPPEVCLVACCMARRSAWQGHFSKKERR